MEWSFELQDKEGYVYKPSYERADTVKPDFGTSENVESGDVKRGWISFEIPKNIYIKDLKFRYKGNNVKSNWILLSDIKTN